VIKIVYGRASITAHKKIPTDVDPIRSLLQSWVDAVAAEDELRKNRHLAELGPLVPGYEVLQIRLRRQTELDNLHFAALREEAVRV